MHITELFPFFYPSYVGFIGPVIVLLVFKLLNRINAPGATQIAMGGTVYFLSVMTGSTCDEFELTDNLTSAYYVSGVWAPIFYCILLSLWLHRKNRLEAKKMTDIDHLIR